MTANTNNTMNLTGIFDYKEDAVDYICSKLEDLELDPKTLAFVKSPDKGDSIYQLDMVDDMGISYGEFFLGFIDIDYSLMQTEVLYFKLKFLLKVKERKARHKKRAFLLF